MILDPTMPSCIVPTLRTIAIFHTSPQINNNQNQHLWVGEPQNEIQTVTNEPSYITNEQYSHSEKGGEEKN